MIKTDNFSKPIGRNFVVISKYIFCYLTDQGNFISAVAIADKIRVPEADTADAWHYGKEAIHKQSEAGGNESQGFVRSDKSEQ